MLENLIPLTLQTASGPFRDILGEARPDKVSGNQSLGRTNTRKETLCRASKIHQGRETGTRGQGKPTERSQRMEDSPKGTRHSEKCY